MTEMMQNLKGIKKELATKDAEIARLKDELRVAESEQYLIADKRRKRISEKNAAVELVDDTNRRRARMKQKRDSADADVHEYVSKASVISERVEIDEGETPATLDRKLERVTRDMVTYSRELGGSREEIRAEADTAIKAHQQALKQVEEFGMLLEVLPRLTFPSLVIGANG
ncbi:hypothetical protein BDW60DRAFT_148594 [Aspergillus nidulans var. acristatus]